VLHLIKGMVVGGAEQLVLSLSRVRDRERFDYHVAHVLADESGALTAALRSEGVDVRWLGATSHLDLRWTESLRRILDAERYDVLHLHLPYTAAFGRLAARSLPRSHQPRIVHTQHNLWTHTTPVVRALNRVTYRLDDADLAVSHAAWSALPRRLRSRTEVLVHGLPLDEIVHHDDVRDSVRAEFGIPPGDVLVATVANMRREKGYEVLLGAAAKLVDEGVAVRFIAVGHGPLEAEVRRHHASLGLGDRFLFTGYRDDAIRIVAGSDIFVLASHHEGFPVAVMEALAAGVAVVATSVGDVPRAVRDGEEGLVVDAGDTDALAEALRTLVADSERREAMGHAALAAGTLFDIRRAAERIEAIYVRVAPI
jgi:glycosyltransferase involved in cell wall biosynthesis